MSDHWDFYPLRVDDQPASIFVDLGICKIAPLESHPSLGFLRVLMLRPKENGLSSQDEFDDLIRLEEHVTAKLTLGEATVYVGRNTSSGNRDFYFYTNDPSAFGSLAHESMRAFPAYQYQVEAREDRAWKTYFEFLYPSKRSMQLIMNQRVREQLEKLGDNLNNPRKIDHQVLMPSLEAQLMFSQEVTRDGFAVDSAPAEPNDEGPFSVEFSRLDQPAQVDGIVLSLFDRAGNLGGVYNGWGCEIEP